MKRTVAFICLLAACSCCAPARAQSPGPPSPNWGVMVSEYRAIITVAPVAALAPALAIGLVSVGVSLIADAVTRSLSLDVRYEVR